MPDPHQTNTDPGQILVGRAFQSAPEEDKPVIRWSPGGIHCAAAEAAEGLAATGGFFDSGGVLVRTTLDRDGLVTGIEPVNDTTLNLILSNQFVWERKAREGWVRCDPPYGVVKALLYGQDRTHLPPLIGLARQPYFGADGELVLQPGYDRKTQVYGAFSPQDYEMEPATRDVAEASLGELMYLTREFDFAECYDQAAAISALFTAVVRPALDVAPAFLFTATGPGSGKSYLAELASSFAGPDQPYRVSFPAKEDEAAKLVVSVLIPKPAVVIFDDMVSDFKSLGPLNRALTSPTTTERLLGSNRTVTVSTRVLWLATGNGIEPKNDARRRVVTVSLAPDVEAAALRTFTGNPVAEVQNNRAQMVKHALNIIRAYQEAGEPTAEVQSVVGYESWSRLCRQPLLWLGLRDPAQSLIDQVTNDPDRQILAEFLQAWHNRFGQHSTTVRKLIAKAGHDADFLELLEELPVLEGHRVSPGRLGWFLKKNRGRRANGLRIEPGDSSERRSWRVVLG